MEEEMFTLRAHRRAGRSTDGRGVGGVTSVRIKHLALLSYAVKILTQAILGQ
jgi:hypothetical protein